MEDDQNENKIFNIEDRYIDDRQLCGIIFAYNIVNILGPGTPLSF